MPKSYYYQYKNVPSRFIFIVLAILVHTFQSVIFKLYYEKKGDKIFFIHFILELSQFSYKPTI